MAYQTGTASNYLDLMDKLRAFVTDSGVMGSQAWTVKRWDSTNGELILCGPGLAGLDEIYVGMKCFFDTVSDYYNWRLDGFIGYSPNDNFENQPGSILSDRPTLQLWDNSIPYWIVANGRRIILVAKISGRYESMYLGFLLPYATPGQFPYPLIMGGSGIGNMRWSDDRQIHSSFINPAVNSTSSSDFPIYPSSLKIRRPSGQWKNIANKGSDGSYLSLSKNNDTAHTWPYITNPTKLITNLDGSYPIFPIVLFDTLPSVYGELDGCYFVPGYQNGAENIIQIGGVNYLVVQNVFRTTITDFWALQLT